LHKIENEEQKMFTRKFLTRTITLVTVFMLALSGASSAFAAPTNDDYANTTHITSLPFVVNADTTDATFESGEPNPCGYGNYAKTVWFSYTPSANVTLTVRSDYYYSVLAINTGSTLDTMAPVWCGAFYPQNTFQALAGVTYNFQLSSLYGFENSIPFSLDVAPPPQVNIGYGPGDPSTFDNVSFYANTYDPAGIYGFTYAWTLSDGTTSDQYNFNHQFATDGDYTVNLTATTADGRSGVAPSQVIQVRTKDVAITTFSVPQTARVNQTKTINVNIQNKRYSDYVQVTLIKGLPGGGEQPIGTLTIYVPAKAKQATTFKFSYTFTSDDATVGKVTFKAIANIVNSRDALPSDNTSIATTLVSK